MAMIVSKILQISDSHIFGNPQTKLLGINTYSSFSEIVKNISANLSLFQPDFIFLTGDISQDFSDASYDVMAKFSIDFPCQFAAILGNHDDPCVFAKYLHSVNMNHDKVFAVNGWKIVMLNSHWNGHVGGILTTAELEFLQRELEVGVGSNVLIFLHHQVLPVDSAWLDRIGLSNAEQFLEIIDRYGNIKMVVSGHVHQETLKIRNNVAFITTPSTSWQFASLSPNFGLDDLMPGYRRIELYDDGSFTTEVIRLPYDERFLPAKNSTGY